MTDSTFKKSKHRRDSFDSEFNTQEDFLLADLQVIPDDTELTLVPLEHLVDEEDAIDRLLVNTGFDTDNESRRADEKLDGFAVDALSLINEIAGSEEYTGQNDQAFVVEPVMESSLQTDIVTIPDTDFQIEEFITDYFDKRSNIAVFEPEIAPDSAITIKPLEDDDLIQSGLKVESLVEDSVEIQYTQPETITKPDTDFQIDDFISDYFDKRSNADVFHPEPALEPEVAELPGLSTPDRTDAATTAQTEHSSPVEQEPDSDETIVENMTERLSANATVLSAGTDVLNQFKSGQEKSVNQHLKSRINKTEKITAITYAALAVGVAALISITALGMMVYDMKNEVSKLTGLLEIIKDDVEAHAVKTSDAAK